MFENATRGIESPDRQHASTSNTCPQCDGPLSGIDTRGRGCHEAEPCGCAISDAHLDSPRVMTDGGRDDPVFAAEIDGDGMPVSFAFGEATTRYLVRVLRSGVAADEAFDRFGADQRKKVEALAEALDDNLPAVAADGGEPTKRVRTAVDQEHLDVDNPLHYLVALAVEAKRYDGNWNGDPEGAARWAVAQWCQELQWVPDLSEYDTGETVPRSADLDRLEAAFVQSATDDRDEEIVTDGGVSYHDLTGFKRDLLWAILDFQSDPDTESYGLALKERLEEKYGKDVHHGQLYPNLDDLVERGLVEKSQLDRRTNEYRLTGAGRALLEDVSGRREQALDQAAGPARADGGRDE